MNGPDGYSFGSFRIDLRSRKLLRCGTPVPIGGRAFDLLCTLIDGRDRFIGKDELLRRVWAGNAVEENNLTVTISVLRKALRDGHAEQELIRTAFGRGYRFVAAIDECHAVTGPGAERRAVPPPQDEGVVPLAVQMPSIAVLSFVNMSGDPGQDHFGDGVAEDIIAELSRNRWLTVIARNSAFAFKGTSAAIPDIARQLGVRYVLEGTVRRAGDRVRVTAHLVDAETNSQVISERFERDVSELFALQDEIAAAIGDLVRPAVYEAEQARSLRRHPSSIDAWAAYQRGVWHFSRFETPESAEAVTWFERAIALDPLFAPGHYGLGLVYLHDGSGYMANAVPDWQPRGERLAAHAVMLDQRDPGAHSILGVARMVRGEHVGALEATGRALALNPSEATAHGTAGATLVFSGRPLEGLRSLATCLRLNPRDPRLRVRHAHIGLGQFFADQMDEAEATAQHIMRTWPAFALGPRLHAMVLSETGRLREARAAIDAAIALSPAPFDNFSLARMPWYGPEAFRRTLAALRRCGWDGPGD